MKFKAAILCAASVVASSAVAEITVTSELQDDLAVFDMTTDGLATWMKNVLVGRNHACSEVYSMAGKVPRTNTDTRRNVAISVNCKEDSYFITVGIKVGWKVHD